MEPKLMSKKKPSFPVNERFNKYLARYNRNTKIPVFYEDLLRFSGSVVVYDQDDEDTYWVRCYYPEFERQEIDESLKKIYNILHSDGSDDMLEFLAHIAPRCSSHEYFGSSKYGALTPSHHGDMKNQYFGRTPPCVLLREIIYFP